MPKTIRTTEKKCFQHIPEFKLFIFQKTTKAGTEHIGHSHKFSYIKNMKVTFSAVCSKFRLFDPFIINCSF